MIALSQLQNQAKKCWIMTQVVAREFWNVKCKIVFDMLRSCAGHVLCVSKEGKNRRCSTCVMYERSKVKRKFLFYLKQREVKTVLN